MRRGFSSTISSDLTELRFDEEIAYGGDVRLGFIERVSLKDGGGELLESGVIDVWCRGLSLSFIPLLHWEDSQFVAEVAVVKTEHAFAAAAALAVEFSARQDLRFYA